MQGLEAMRRLKECRCSRAHRKSTDVSRLHGCVRGCLQTPYGARRLGFGKVAAVLHELVQLLLATGCSAVLDMDDVCQRESLEVIGRVCFGIKFGALRYCLISAGFIADGLPHRTPSSLACACRPAKGRDLPGGRGRRRQAPA